MHSVPVFIDCQAVSEQLVAAIDEQEDVFFAMSHPAAESRGGCSERGIPDC